MFTLKLYSYPRTRIVEAQSFTVYWYDHGTSAQISTHQKDPTDDRAFYVGDPSPADTIVRSEPWYDKAIIENSNGKTTEVISPIPFDSIGSNSCSSAPPNP